MNRFGAYLTSPESAVALPRVLRAEMSSHVQLCCDEVLVILKRLGIGILGLGLVFSSAVGAAEVVDLQEGSANNPSPVNWCHQLTPAPEFSNALTVGIAPAAVTSRIVPALYIPSDATQYLGNQGKALLDYHYEGVSRGLSNVEHWYSRELPSKNVIWGDLILYRGHFTAAQCFAEMGLCIDDVVTNLKLDPWAPGDKRQKLLIIGAGFLGWAGGVGNTEGQGYAVVGLESLMDLPKCTGNWWCTQDFWHGTVAHELGHTFGLPHSADPNSIMNFHGEWVDKHLTDSEPGFVEIDPAAKKKRANWSYCDIDFECASKRCGGNGSEPRLLCLPSAAYPKQAANIPDGMYCRRSAECNSSICGIGPNGEHICLRYPAGFFPKNAPLSQ